jgi:hypothetical protein
MTIVFESECLSTCPLYVTIWDWAGGNIDLQIGGQTTDFVALMERALFGLIMLKSERFFDTPETCRLENGSPNRLPVPGKTPR